MPVKFFQRKITPFILLFMRNWGRKKTRKRKREKVPTIEKMATRQNEQKHETSLWKNVHLSYRLTESIEPSQAHMQHFQWHRSLYSQHNLFVFFFFLFEGFFEILSQLLCVCMHAELLQYI